MGAIVTITVLIWRFWFIGGLNKSVPPQLHTAIGYVLPPEDGLFYYGSDYRNKPLGANWMKGNTLFNR